MGTRGITFLATILLGGVGLFVATFADRAADRLSPPIGAPGLSHDRGVGERSPVRGAAPAPRDVSGGSDRTPLASPGPDGPSFARVDAAVSRLATALSGEPFDRAGWERRTRAVAASLGEEATQLLFDIAGEPERTTEERIVSAELLRALQAAGGKRLPPLPPPTLHVLRATVLDADTPGAASVAAGRALSALGERADRAYFLRLLAADDDARRRSWASWSLRAAVDDDAAFGLLDLVRGSERAELALGTLDDWIRARAPGTLDRAFVATATAELEGLLGDPRASPAARRRALATLGSLDTEDAPATIRRLLAAEGSDAALRRQGLTTLSDLGTRDSVVVLEELILDPEAARCAPLLLAEAWSRLPDDLALRSDVNAVVGETLLRAVQDSPSPDERRCALFALGRAGTSEAAAAMAEALRSDPEPSVRAAAVWALGRGLDFSERITALEDAGDHDASPQVRRLARHALSRLR